MTERVCFSSKTQEKTQEKKQFLREKKGGGTSNSLQRLEKGFGDLSEFLLEART